MKQILLTMVALLLRFAFNIAAAVARARL